MRKHFIIFFGLSVIVAAAFLAVPRVLASGFWAPRVVDSFALFPDLELDKYAGGQLGVIRNKFAMSYLLVAYRYLVNAPLSADEQKSICDLWNFRRGINLQSSAAAATDTTALKNWSRARMQVPGARETAISTTAAAPTTTNFVNCEDEAFINATQTLNERIKKFGAGSVEVREWLKAQDQVFCNCDVDPGHYRNWEDPPAPAGPFLPGSTMAQNPTSFFARHGNRKISISCTPASGDKPQSVRIEMTGQP